MKKREVNSKYLCYLLRHNEFEIVAEAFDVLTDKRGKGNNND